MESFIVLSYRTHLPGELSHIWNRDPSSHRGNHRKGGSTRYLALLGVVLSILQSLASGPAVLQRMFIRFVQPFFLAVLLYAGSYIIESQVYIAVTAVGVALLVVVMIYKYLKSNFSASSIQSVHPIGADSTVQSEQPITLPSPHLNESLDSFKSVDSDSIYGIDFSIDSSLYGNNDTSSSSSTYSSQKSEEINFEWDKESSNSAFSLVSSDSDDIQKQIE
mmetsp:Transcript_17046/g.24687  ORF Transcript_17046/g.24687 Transcript_17046/m.24687 type:complete len:220 (-) Transcript_17046:85-744(-)